MIQKEQCCSKEVGMAVLNLLHYQSEVSPVFSFCPQQRQKKSSHNSCSVFWIPVCVYIALLSD